MEKTQFNLLITSRIILNIYNGFFDKHYRYYYFHYDEKIISLDKVYIFISLTRL